MRDVPAVTPVTMPVAEPTETFALLLLHVPPDTALLNVVLEPTHVFNVPVMDDGTDVTVTVK
jgi:hypothetical protein